MISDAGEQVSPSFQRARKTSKYIVISCVSLQAWTARDVFEDSSVVITQKLRLEARYGEAIPAKS